MTPMQLRNTLVTGMLAAGICLAPAGAANAEPPGPGAKHCSPGQNNTGGGPGGSGPGDKHGAPLKAPKSCPGS
jgi:hypothetical protein